MKQAISDMNFTTLVCTFKKWEWYHGSYNSGSQTSRFNDDSDRRFREDSDGDSTDKTSLESPIFLNRWIASAVAPTFWIAIQLTTIQVHSTLPTNTQIKSCYITWMTHIQFVTVRVHSRFNDDPSCESSHESSLESTPRSSCLTATNDSLWVNSTMHMPMVWVIVDLGLLIAIGNEDHSFNVSFPFHPMTDFNGPWGPENSNKILTGRAFPRDDSHSPRPCWQQRWTFTRCKTRGFVY